MKFTYLEKIFTLDPWKKKSYNFQAYIIQFTVFAYSIFRYISRSYESYGFLDSQSFSYPRWWLADLYPLPLSHFSTFQFIYDFIPRLDSNGIKIIQYYIILFSFLGLLGLIPRISAFITFLLSAHLEGILISADAELSGGTLLISSLFIFCCCKKESFYRITSFKPITFKSKESSNLIFLFSLLVSIFYFLSGLNKLVDVGLLWPFELGLDIEKDIVLQTNFLFNQRFANLFFIKYMSSHISLFAGFATLYAELSAILFVTKFRYKYLTIITLILMHLSIYLTSGINFIGNSFLLIAILDWNSLLEEEKIYYDDKCVFCIRCVDFIKKWIKPYKLEYRKLSELNNSENLNSEDNINIKINQSRAKKAIALASEDDVMYGFNTIANILLRSKLFVIGLFMYLPPINLLGIIFYKFISKNRYLFLNNKCNDGSCDYNDH